MRFAPLLITLAALAFEECAAGFADVFSSQHLYDWGWHGLYPTVGFRSFSARVPHLNFLKWDERCTNGYYFVSPKGRLVDNPGPYIIDGRGNLVWSGAQFGPVADFQPQTYKGKQYLTFWKNTDGLTMGWGRGRHVMLDENYEVYKEVHPVGEGMMGDLHEFHITSEDTALLTLYMPRTWDLSSIGGPKDGWIMDSYFQEIDIETGKLLFEWHASDHIPLEDTIRYYAGRDTGLTPERGFDYFHINSMDKDKDGNYVISGRHTHTIHGITPNGSVLWTLGGKSNQFEDLSDGRATDFASQHHIRINDDNVITMFDNAKAERAGPALPVDYSRGLIIQLDLDKLTAELLHEIHDPDHPKHADSQGSAQLWDNGRSMLVDFGFYPAFTEFDTETNEVLCDVHFGPSLLFPLGFIGSYRAFKGDWTGKPILRPHSFLSPAQGAFYVSWNGATEVDKWILQGADWDALESGNWVDLVVKDREGRFETAFEIDDSMPAYVRAAAVDSNGSVLMHSQTISRALGNGPPPEPVDIIFAWLSWAAKWGFIGLMLWAWDWCRPMRSRLWRIIVKVWHVARPSFRRFCCFCLPGRSHGVLGLPRWRRTGKQHELQPLYDSDEHDDP